MQGELMKNSRKSDPFVSTKKESGGMGIGLNIAKKIIDSNDGKLKLIIKIMELFLKLLFKRVAKFL